MNHKESRLPFNVTMLRSQEGDADAIVDFSADTVSPDEFDEGEVVLGSFSVSGETYEPERVLRVLESLAEFQDDNDVHSFLRDVVLQTRKWVLENECAIQQDEKESK